ncbi:23S rRNA (uracil(1939)-C(5))-methyltransferase RlmD [Hufsiella ginkgonis]|uniref:23S rRNA (Uracil(1939)-C(5))-methyltransferase RlmD n=1 Tax=Hufsiella ginkgonis TaxID=2695274 RepID=A0A7K1Y1L1_9SPHI|nr:23S rRNA (uracil(1939)-C(5))-methyltransferase RlmD [Hufsiella ginkgonis]MXV17135.1 23S rRNA (uracil(1939)-C(5))-methyltransferase RlmD [Hufsiella ginkgonis]
MRANQSGRKIVEQVEVIDIAEEGKGVGKDGDLVIFIDKGVPGDVVNVEVMRKKKKFLEARIHSVVKFSSHRTQAFCIHFGVCGGCKWQHMTYEAQLRFKQKSVTDALQRLARVDVSQCESILPSVNTRFYRNKLEFTFSDKRWLTQEDVTNNAPGGPALGFHVPLRFDKILDIRECHLQADPSNAIRNEIRGFALRENISFYDLRNHEGALRNLIVRSSSTGELMVIVVFAYPAEEQVESLMGFVAGRFPGITSLLYIINQKKNDTIFDQEIRTFRGRDHIFEEMHSGIPGETPLRFKIGAKSFYQTNSVQANELYRITKEFAGLKGHERVYDLYTGAGTIANFVARGVKEVIGVEYVPSAIEDAYVNSAINGIKNTRFFAGDMKDILTPQFVQEQGRPDVVITDPPRAGMHPEVVARLLGIAAAKIVYVSCNAATQARDIALLKEKYTVTRIRPVDMFPHTQHVENVALLELTVAGQS